MEIDLVIVSPGCYDRNVFDLWKFLSKVVKHFKLFDMVFSLENRITQNVQLLQRKKIILNHFDE